MAHRRNGRTARGWALSLTVVLAAAAISLAGPSLADVSEVTGSAYGVWTKVSLFGGPAGAKGPQASVTLPSGGAGAPVVAKLPSAAAVYGPATIFGGKWPSDVDIAPPSGPITSTTTGTTGQGGSVTSTVDIVLRDPPDPKSPGGFGPSVPNEGDELHSSCTASESGVSGSVRIVNGILSTSTDESGEPKDTEPIPTNPSPNYTRTGQITNVGDNWKIIYNEQTTDADGTLTVNAIHMFLLGPIAVGEQIVGQVRCGVKHVPGTPTAPPTAAPTTVASGGGGGSTVTTAAASGGGGGSTVTTAGSGGGTTTTVKPGTKTTTTTKPGAGTASTAPSSVAGSTTLPGSDTTPTSDSTMVTSEDSPPDSQQIADAKNASSSGGSALPIVLAVILIGGGATGGAWWVRRRRSDGGQPLNDAS